MLIQIRNPPAIKFSVLNEKKQINAAVLVAEDGDILFQGAFGYANLADKRLLQEDSLFELASLSKPFTALGIYNRADPTYVSTNRESLCLDKEIRLSTVLRDPQYSIPLAVLIEGCPKRFGHPSISTARGIEY